MPNPNRDRIGGGGRDFSQMRRASLREAGSEMDVVRLRQSGQRSRRQRKSETVDGGGSWGRKDLNTVRRLTKISSGFLNFY
jgi:hypothetical protein